MHKITTICICLILFAANTYGVVPSEINYQLIKTVFDAAKLPWSSSFTDEQRRLIKKGYTDMLMEKYHKEILESKSSRDEIATAVNRELNVIFSDKPFISRSNTVNKIKEGIDRAQGKKKEFLTQLRFKNIDLPIVIQLDQDVITINLYGIPFLGRHHCLMLEYEPASPVLELKWIGTQDPICPIPVEQKGTFLLELSEEIAKALGKKKITLWDASSVLCRANQKSVDLFLLKIFQQGKSWYESKGYSHIPEQEEKYRSKVNSLRQYKLIDLENDLEKKEGLISKITKTKYLNYYEYLKSIKPLLKYRINQYNMTQNDGLLAGFLAWLYKQSCKEYTEVVDLLFPLEKFDIKDILEISRFFPRKHAYFKNIN